MGRLEPIIGTNIVDDIRLGHTWHEVSVIKQIIETENPSWFIEVGVHEGGLSYLLIPQYIELKYLGIELYCDLVRPNVREVYKEFGQELHCGDCFDPALIARIQSLEGKKVIYCDGGNKVAELKAYKYACNHGDLIFCHDYHDRKRLVREVPPEHVHPEVRPEDVEHMYDAGLFVDFYESVLKETRIAGWMRYL